MTQEINSNIRIIHVINGPITETITIRPIEEKDNKEIAALIRKVFEEFDAPKTESVYSDPLTDRLFQSFYQHPRAGYWVVEYNSNIVGGCGFYPTEGLDTDCAEIVKFYLSPLLRGKKVGSALLNMVEEKAQESGYKQLYIESFPQFQNAVSLYERKDFRHLESRLGNSGHTATTIHMIKNIQE
ncbi:GNAT family N-acetyltransferase [Bacteroides cellulosilyticus]|jgi:hypothetical protein|uniref:GNAT family N-acetyltransferase n=1 Tax=Bacteroides cellulosilyticus TaxID=246787 RepID=A0A6L3JXR4_9BACE|nr:GNAT family N-acetyltransferase [Bacteroides cellulosilyticus]KAA5416959.1 GNAT family N-acetyltransferase [Bacteroides cellulosilyticus]